MIFRKYVAAAAVTLGVVALASTAIARDFTIA